MNLMNITAEQLGVMVTYTTLGGVGLSVTGLMSLLLAGGAETMEKITNSMEGSWGSDVFMIGFGTLLLAGGFIGLGGGTIVGDVALAVQALRAITSLPLLEINPFAMGLAGIGFAGTLAAGGIATFKAGQALKRSIKTIKKFKSKTGGIENHLGKQK